MRRTLLITLTLCLLTAYSGPVRAQQAFFPKDSIRAMLVTCSPGALIYEVYGHTAIRIQNLTDGTDIVYNYGVFDFSSPHFVWRWVRGETDYLLGRYPWSIFCDEYKSRGSTIHLQELNLTQHESTLLAGLLTENSMPKNRVYRYNFFYNNCATMALDKIEQAVSGHIAYQSNDSIISFRNVIHRFNGKEPWNQFVIDLAIGAEADAPISERQKAFAPILLMDLIENASIITTDTLVPLVTAETKIYPADPLIFPEHIIYPLQAMILFFLLILLLCLYDWNRGHLCIILDIVLFGIQGLAGIVIAFLYFFSSHPATSSNWLLICLNPLPLICLPFMIHNIRHRKLSVFLVWNFLINVIFILSSSKIPQYISLPTLILLGTFALRSLCDIHYQITHHAKFPMASVRLSKRKNAAVAAIILLSTISPARAQNATHTPKLIVGITIDQLDQEYVRRLMPLFKDDGFRRFLLHGYCIPQVSFDYDNHSRAAAIASLYTGTSPFYHGIVSDKWIDRSNQMTIDCVHDKDETGINTSDHSSPKRLQVLTITDQLELATKGNSIVCSIAAEKDAAILAGGHDPDLVLWMNDADCQWCTSSYYGTFPSWADNANSSNMSKEDDWKPSLPLSYYIRDNVFPRSSSFSYSPKRGDTREIKSSPIANRRVTDMAITTIDAMELGMTGATDFLAVTLYAGGYAHQPTGLESIELQDTYARLDQDLEQLITHIEKKIGSDNVLFFLTSTGCKDISEPVVSNPRMPTGTVYMERVTALLNLYLSALYEKGEYINAYNGTQLYIDRTLLEKQNLSIQTIYDNCVDLLLQMSGIRGVFTQRDLLFPNLNQDALRQRNALNPDCSGDLMLEIIPGWTIADEQHNTNQVEDRSTANIPIMLYGNGVRAWLDERPTPAGALAATLSWVLGIPVPSACKAAPITDIWFNK